MGLGSGASPVPREVKSPLAEFDLDLPKGALARYFASRENVLLAYLFGSQARGRSWAESDIDLAVLLTDRPDDGACLDARLDLLGGLMDQLETDEVDVLILNQAPPALRHAVLSDGIELFCRDRRVAMEFRLRAFNEYLDFLPIQRRHERAFLEKARRGALFLGDDTGPRPSQPDPQMLEHFTRIPGDDL